MGQTKQYLRSRVKQHDYDCKLGNIDKFNKTALAFHPFNEGHNFNFNITIVYKECNF